MMSLRHFRCSSRSEAKSRRSKVHLEAAVHIAGRSSEQYRGNIMSPPFKTKILALEAVKMPLHPPRDETVQDRLQQAHAVERDGCNVRPVLIDDNAVIVDGAATYAALYSNDIDKVKVLFVGGASEKDIRTLRRALRVLP